MIDALDALDQIESDLLEAGMEQTAAAMHGPLDALRAALAAAPRAEGPYTCPDEPPTDETRHLYCPGCLSYFNEIAAPRPEGLDVERLARAINAIRWPGTEVVEQDVTEATSVAREYARLSDTGDTPKEPTDG